MPSNWYVLIIPPVNNLGWREGINWPWKYPGRVVEQTETDINIHIYVGRCCTLRSHTQSRTHLPAVNVVPPQKSNWLKRYWLTQLTCYNPLYSSPSFLILTSLWVICLDLLSSCSSFSDLLFPEPAGDSNSFPDGGTDSPVSSFLFFSWPWGMTRHGDYY